MICWKKLLSDGILVSKNKYDIKEVLAKAKNVGIDSLNAASMIDELTSKIEHAYVKLRSRYDVAPERLERLNRWVDRGVGLNAQLGIWFIFVFLHGILEVGSSVGLLLIMK